MPNYAKWVERRKSADSCAFRKSDIDEMGLTVRDDCIIIRHPAAQFLAAQTTIHRWFN
jgi:hypothetical protein